MTTTLLPPPETATPMSRRDQVAFTVFATWIITGLFLDGWSHRLDAPESFFSPWHGVLYSGFAASVVYGLVDGRRRPRSGPVAGERLTLAGAALFAVGGFGDMLWHEALGIEEDLEALLSPTHLALAFGGVLAASSPLRAAWATAGRRVNGLRELWPVVVSTALATAVVMFFVQFASAFLLEELTMAREDSQAYGVASILVTTLVLVVPMLLLHRRWAVPAGSFTLLFAVVTIFTLGLDGFTRLPLLAAVLAAGAVADRFRDRPPLVLATATTAVLWSSFFLAYRLTEPFSWTAEMWTGSVVLAVGAAAALALLASPVDVPRGSARPPGC